LKNELGPRYFLLENVRMKKEYQDVISKLLGVEPVNINSNLVSAQNRNRFYWTNIPGVKQPEDRNIYLKDIVEDNVSEKYHCNLDIEGTRSIKNLLDGMRLETEKAKFVTAQVQRGTNSGATNLIIQKSRGFNNGGIKAKNGKTPALTSNSWEHNNHLLLKLSRKLKLKKYQNKASCLTVAGNSGGNHSDMDLLFFTNNYILRRLTPTECEALQTIPFNFTSIVSNTQRNKMIGNSFTIEIIANILKGIK
jgi:DNA (cytosine-5)-methyltransferase 3A